MRNESSCVEVITPKLAQEYLKLNTNNRPISNLQVNRLVEQMREGKYMLNGEPIIFSESNVLLQGQHRLLACVKSGCDIETFVVRGVKDEVFHTLDSGRNRTVSDVFAISGVPDYAKTSSIVIAYIRLTKSLGSFTGLRGYKSLGVNKKDIIDVYKNNEELIYDIKLYSNRLTDRMKLLTLSEVGAIMTYLIKNKKHNKDVVKRFFGELFDSSENVTINALRLKLINNLASDKKMTQRYKITLIAKAWNAYICGKQAKLLYWNEDKEGYIDFE